MTKKGEENLIPLNKRTKSEQRKIQKKGGIASGIARNKKKKELEERKTIVETLKSVLYTDVTNKKLLQTLDKSGITEPKNYLTALVSSAVLRSVKKGNLADLLRLIEMIEGKPTERIEITNIDKSVMELQDYLAQKRKKNSNDTT